MGKFFYTWSLMGPSWQILKKDKEMLIFPLISGICCLLVLATFALPLLASGGWQPRSGVASTNARLVYYAILLFFYFCNYFVIVFFNAAIIACATIRMSGGDPAVSDGLRAAMARLPLIARWALFSATVGLILRIIENRFKMVGRFVAGLLGMAWTLVSFLVLPVLVVEKKDPTTALKESAALLKKTWSEQLIGNFSFGLFFFVFSIPAFIFLLLRNVAGGGVGMMVGSSLAVVYLIGIALVQSTLQTIFQAALYLYARNGQVPAGFQQELLANSLTVKDHFIKTADELSPDPMIIWKCKKCGELLEEQFDSCWKCNTPRTGGESTLVSNDEMLPAEIECPGCGTGLELTESERIERKFTCPECNENLTIKD